MQVKLVSQKVCSAMPGTQLHTVNCDAVSTAAPPILYFAFMRGSQSKDCRLKGWVKWAGWNEELISDSRWTERMYKHIDFFQEQFMQSYFQNGPYWGLLCTKAQTVHTKGKSPKHTDYICFISFYWFLKSTLKLTNWSNLLNLLFFHKFECVVLVKYNNFGIC